MWARGTAVEAILTGGEVKANEMTCLVLNRSGAAGSNEGREKTYSSGRALEVHSDVVYAANVRVKARGRRTTVCAKRAGRWRESWHTELECVRWRSGGGRGEHGRRHAGEGESLGWGRRGKGGRGAVSIVPTPE